jgi:hypothetical protein
MECEFLNGGADESSASLDLIDSFKPISNVASLNHPSEGPWFVLPKEKQVSLSSGTLIKSDHDILRVWNKKIKFCLKAN